MNLLNYSLGICLLIQLWSGNWLLPSRPTATAVHATVADTVPKVRSLFRAPFVLDKNKTTIGSPLPIYMQEKADLILIEGTKQIDRDKLDSIDPDDIESIHVDKSEETMAKYRSEYGEKADKGVVIIRLKSSKVL